METFGLKSPGYGAFDPLNPASWESRFNHPVIRARASMKEAQQ
jgi:hypothetical protein